MISLCNAPFILDILILADTMTQVKNDCSSNKTILLPNSQLIGAQKAGTSAVADWLFKNTDGGKCNRPIVFEDEPSLIAKRFIFLIIIVATNRV